jgi:predicted O-methyltransferase YrrM
MTTLEKIREKYDAPEKATPFFIKEQVRKDLYFLFKELGFKVGAEIGVYKGRNARKMLQIVTDLKLYCVDFWEPIGRRTVEFQAKTYKRMKMRLRRYLKNGRAKVIKKSSMDGLKDFEDGCLDFVYIDANHNFDFVMEDIIEWSKKVKPGGIVSGHDYYKSPKFGVVVAVNAYTKAHHIPLWFVLDDEGKPKELGGRRRTKKEKNSWFFVKGEK